MMNIQWVKALTHKQSLWINTVQELEYDIKRQVRNKLKAQDYSWCKIRKAIG